MDQKKTLWIIAAVGAFLLVVFGAALIMYSPAKQQNQTVKNIAQVERTQPSGWTTPEEIQPISPITTTEKVPEMIVLSDNTKVYNVPSETPDTTTIDLNTLKQEVLGNHETQTSTPQSQNINITVNIPETEKVITNEYYISKQEDKKLAVAPAPTAPVAKTEAPKQTEQKKPAATKVTTKVTTKTATTTVNTSTPQPKPVTQYWVQVAAYSNKKGAENARAVLDTNKIPADIFTFQDNKNTLFYRVRVGPYTTKSEAEYWRTRIIQINEFSKAESYVTSTTN